VIHHNLGGGHVSARDAALPATERTLTQEGIAAYADASGDHNPLHIDPAFAATTRFGGTIAHGMLVLAFLSDMLTGAFGPPWAESGALKIRFRDAARPGDVVTTGGTVVARDGRRVRCEVECVNQNGTVLVNGEAEVTIA
jgi:3-hydroxybutyryl-CoA dehydratase